MIEQSKPEKHRQCTCTYTEHILEHLHSLRSYDRLHTYTVYTRISYSGLYTHQPYRFLL